MSKYVREVDSIQGLRNTPTSDAAAAHVRTPTGKSGVFVPFDSDPFGNGDDGAVALEGPSGWWVRKPAVEEGRANPLWWGLSESASGATNAAALQSAIDFAQKQPVFEDKRGTVRVPQGKYEIGTRVDILANVDLVGSATYKPSDFSMTMFLLEGEAYCDINVDVSDVKFTGVVLLLDSGETDNEYAPGPNTPTQYKLEARSRRSQGTCVRYHQNGDGAVTFVHGTVFSSGFETVFDLHSEATSGGFVNGNEFRGEHWNPDRYVLQRGPGPSNGNNFRAQVQPSSDSLEIWKQESNAEASDNIMMGRFWDPQKLSNTPFRLEGAGRKNTVVQASEVYGPSDVSGSSGGVISLNGNYISAFSAAFSQTSKPFEPNVPVQVEGKIRVFDPDGSLFASFEARQPGGGVLMSYGTTGAGNARIRNETNGDNVFVIDGNFTDQYKLEEGGQLSHPELTSPPSNPDDGDLAYADGSGWDPGSGEGFYGYEAGTWVKL